MVAAADDVVVAVVVSRALFQNPKSIGLVAGGGLIWSWSCRSGCDGNSSIDLSLSLSSTSCNLQRASGVIPSAVVALWPARDR